LTTERARRLAFVEDLLTEVSSRLMRLRPLDACLTDLLQEPEPSQRRAKLKGVVLGLHCCGQLSDGQVQRFHARIEQGAAEGWL
jgi:hypothetical protein